MTASTWRSWLTWSSKSSLKSRLSKLKRSIDTLTSIETVKSLNRNSSSKLIRREASKKKYKTQVSSIRMMALRAGSKKRRRTAVIRRWPLPPTVATHRKTCRRFPTKKWTFRSVYRCWSGVSSKARLRSKTRLESSLSMKSSWRSVRFSIFWAKRPRSLWKPSWGIVMRMWA